jgi:hypothetical protein
MQELDFERGAQLGMQGMCAGPGAAFAYWHVTANPFFGIFQLPVYLLVGLLGGTALGFFAGLCGAALIGACTDWMAGHHPKRS